MFAKIKLIKMNKITFRVVVIAMMLSITALSAQLSYEGALDYGRMNDLTYDLVTQDKVYGLTLGNHIMVSTDNGTSWDVLYSFPENGTSIKGLRNLGTDKLSFYVSNSGTLINNTIYIYDLNTDVVTAVNPPSESADRIWVNSYDVQTSNPNVILYDMGYRIGAATFSKVHYSTDGGATWTQVYYHIDNNEIYTNNVAINPSDSQKLYIALGNGPNSVEGGLLYSTDGGATWTEKVTGQCLKPISFDPSNSNHIWMGTATGFNTTVQNIYESTDGGDTWSISPIVWDDYFLEEINYIAIDPSDPNHIVVLEANEMAITTDGGVNWTNVVYSDDPNSYYYGLKAAFNPFQAGEMFVNADYHPLRSTDGGMTVNRVYNPFFNASSTAISSQGDGHLFYSVQRGLVHKNLTTGVENSYYVEPINFVFSDPAPIFEYDTNIAGRVYLFLDGFSGELTMVSNDYGATFTPIKQTFFDRLLHIVTDPGNPNGVVVSYQNGGTEYIEFSSSPVASALSMPSGNYHLSTYIDPNDSSIIFVGIGGEIYKSTDGTGSWTNVSTGLSLDPVQDSVFQIERNPNNSSEFLAATSAGIFKSTDDGTTWSQVYSGTNVEKISYSDVNPGVIVAGVYSFINTNAQLLLSDNNGDTWQALPLETIASAGSRSMDFAFSTDMVEAYIATYDMGLIKVSVSTSLLSVEIPDREPNNMVLYPNPASDVLNVAIPNGVNISKINVYSLLGKMVLSTDNKKVNVSELDPALYLIEVVDDSGNIHVKRFIKQ